MKQDSAAGPRRGAGPPEAQEEGRTPQRETRVWGVSGARARGERAGSFPKAVATVVKGRERLQAGKKNCTGYFISRSLHFLVCKSGVTVRPAC